MNLFLEVFRYYKRPFRGLFYMPARWAIVPFVQIESFMPRKGTVIDIGCGEGIMAVLLAINSRNRQVFGFDIDHKKLKLAQGIAQKIPNLSLQKLNVLKGKLPKSKGFVLSDFLHHIPQESHQTFLKKVVDALEKGGIIVIKEIDLKDEVRSKISRILDFIFYPFENVSFIDSRSLIECLTSLGLRVNIIKVRKWFPGSTTLFICRK